MKKISLLWTIFFALFWLSCPLEAQTIQGDAELPAELHWPRIIETPEAKILIYQPQLEQFEGNRLRYRFAASIQSPRMEAPEFGAVWVEARLEIQRDKRSARLAAVENVQSRFPSATQESERWFADVLKKEMPTWDIVLSLDQIVAGLETAEARMETEQALNNKPPKIIYSNKPAALVLVDGDPILKPIENTDLMAVINTPYPIVFRKQDKTYYLIGKETWYRSREIAAQWQETPDPPADVAAVARESADDDQVESSVAAGVVVFGATEPAEILALDGEPRFVPFPGNNIMYVENTDNDLLYEVESGKYYLLLSGRWYSAKRLDDAWTYVPPGKVPKTFADIPPGSKKGDLRASVPGTDEAKDAVMDARIPQTAAIKRSEAALAVEYDGAPEFKKIEGAGLDYAVNTATPVIRAKGKYYAVDNGVWFTADSAQGPWVVADSVPAQVRDIPPDCPVNHIKYVHIYDSTPEIVYVGYTPGYTGCYIYHGVVVYGTGYHYRPWYRHYYYPRPLTYGFSVRYSAYHGWGFGVVFYHGPFIFHYGYAWGYPRFGGWWGPPRYRPPYYRPPHYRPPPPRPPGHRPPVAKPPIAKPPAGGKPSRRPVAQRPAGGNLYDKRAGRIDRARPGTADIRDKKPVGKPAALPNNVYTDPQGNVYRKNKSDWEQYRDRQWQRPSEGQPGAPTQRPAQQPAQRPAGSVQRPAQQPGQRPADSVQKPTTRPQQRPPTPRQPSWDDQRRLLEQQHNSRNRGNQRTQQYQRSQQSSPGGGNGRQAPSRSRGGGAGGSR